MIYEGSCDTEDWSNDAENSALQLRNKWHLKNKKYIYKAILNWSNISQYYSFIYSLSNKCSLGEHKTAILTATIILIGI